MTRAGQLAEEGAAEGTMVIADQQTAGRGRLRRGWWAPAGTSLLLSLIFRPPLLPSQAQRLTMICSLSVCEAVERVGGVRAQVKWPNDVLVGERKLCGILTELGIQGSRLDFAVVGIGINVNLDLRDAPSFLAPATSLLQETGRPVSRLALLSALLGHIERRYLELRQGRSSHTEWADRLATLGHEVQVTSGVEQQIGLAVGVDQDGALLLRLEGGQQRRVLAGDVTLRPTSGPAGQE
jgi:BirA family biotin operon repressor/biotin-[acetyl-CoA-carboxylase] ligase